jgi:2,4-dienoyl-CoA reductase-like NADH-dependent reductase (Old Yellow Enzyme family)
MDLFTPIQVGRYTLPNRIVMAPLTRCRWRGQRPHSFERELLCSTGIGWADY